MDDYIFMYILKIRQFEFVSFFPLCVFVSISGVFTK